MKGKLMHKKALTVAIAGALAVPMAAQAVDMSVSGHINRALFITDSDTNTGATVKDNGTSGTRIRVKGSSELMGIGNAGVLLEYSATGSLGLRYADLWYSGGFGKFSIGQGDQGGEGSVWYKQANVWGTGHGQDHNSVAAGYYTSLDGGHGRNERIRYDAPAIGPVSAAVSIGNGDQFSAGIGVSQSVGDTSFSAGLGSIQWGGSTQSTVSGSAGISLPAGISISAAWGVGKNHPGMAAIPAIPAHFRLVDITTPVMLDSDERVAGEETATFDGHMVELRRRIDTGAADGADAGEVADGELAKMLKAELFDMLDDQTAAGMDNLGCNPATDPGVAMPGGAPNTATPMCGMRQYPLTPGRLPQITDPSFFTTAVSYAFGDTSVGVSWYQANDMNNDGSKLTAVGVGVNHALPKIGANVYAAAQNYAIEDAAIGTDSDSTVVMIGTRITF